VPGGAGEASVASDTACSPRVVAVGTEHVGGRVRTGGPWSEFVPSWEAAADGPLVTVRLRSAPGSRADAVERVRRERHPVRDGGL